MADVGVASAEENELELSDLDANEAEKVDSFFLSGCGCKLGPKGASCSSHINKDLALLSRTNCQQLDEVELDIVVLSQFKHCGHTQTNPCLNVDSLLIRLASHLP